MTSLLNENGTLREELTLRIGETEQETIDRLKKELFAIEKELNKLDKNNTYTVRVVDKSNLKFVIVDDCIKTNTNNNPIKMPIVKDESFHKIIDTCKKAPYWTALHPKSKPNNLPLNYISGYEYLSHNKSEDGFIGIEEVD